MWYSWPSGVCQQCWGGRSRADENGNPGTPTYYNNVILKKTIRIHMGRTGTWVLWWERNVTSDYWIRWIHGRRIFRFELRPVNGVFRPDFLYPNNAHLAPIFWCVLRLPGRIGGGPDTFGRRRSWGKIATACSRSLRSAGDPRGTTVVLIVFDLLKIGRNDSFWFLRSVIIIIITTDPLNGVPSYVTASRITTPSAGQSVAMKFRWVRSCARKNRAFKDRKL